MWVHAGGDARVPLWRGMLRRVNPMSAAGTKQGRQGFEGRKPSRGWPNPEGGTKRAGKARGWWTFESSCAVGSRSPWEESARCGGSARFRGARL
jgi:hypothetical protein